MKGESHPTWAKTNNDGQSGREKLTCPFKFDELKTNFVDTRRMMSLYNLPKMFRY